MRLNAALRATLAPLALLLVLAVSGCGSLFGGPASPESTGPAVTAPATSAPASTSADPTPSESTSPAEPTSSPTAGDRVVVTGKDDTFRLVLPPKWKVAPGDGDLDVTVSPGGILKPNKKRDERNASGYQAGAIVIAVRPEASTLGESNVNIGNRPAGGITDVEDLAEASKSALQRFGLKQIKSRTTEVGGDPAVQVKGGVEQGGTKLSFTQYYVIRDDLVWITTVTEFDGERSVAPQIAEGLDFSI